MRTNLCLVLCFLAAFGIHISDSQTLTHSSTVTEGQPLTLTCTTTDFAQTIFFEQNNANRGGCLVGGTCSTSVSGYQTPTQSGTQVTQMIITLYSQSRDGGDWTCTYGGAKSGVKAIAVTGTPITSGGGLGTGEIIGIVIGVLFLIALVVVAIFVVVKYLCTPTPEVEQETATVGSDKTLLEEKLKSVGHIQSVKWKFKGKQVTIGGGKYIGGMVISPALTITSIQINDSGKYKCSLVTDRGNLELIVNLSVEVAEVTERVGCTTTLLEKELVSLHPIKSVKWKFNGRQVMIDESKYQKGTTYSPDALTIIGTKVRDAGRYECSLVVGNENMKIIVHLNIEG